MFRVFAIVIWAALIREAARDVPETYGSRHEGLEHSWMYPNIANALADAEDEKEGRK
jgi:hypothetical protein